MSYFLFMHYRSFEESIMVVSYINRTWLIISKALVNLYNPINSKLKYNCFDIHVPYKFILRTFNNVN